MKCAFAILDKEFTFLFTSKSFIQEYNLENPLEGKGFLEVFPKNQSKLQEISKVFLGENIVFEHFQTHPETGVKRNWKEIFIPFTDPFKNIIGIHFYRIPYEAEMPSDLGEEEVYYKKINVSQLHDLYQYLRTIAIFLDLLNISIDQIKNEKFENYLYEMNKALSGLQNVMNSLT